MTKYPTMGHEHTKKRFHSIFFLFQPLFDEAKSSLSFQAVLQGTFAVDTFFFIRKLEIFRILDPDPLDLQHFGFLDPIR